MGGRGRPILTNFSENLTFDSNSTSDSDESDVLKNVQKYKNKKHAVHLKNVKF